MPAQFYKELVLCAQVQNSLSLWTSPWFISFHLSRFEITLEFPQKWKVLFAVTPVKVTGHWQYPYRKHLPRLSDRASIKSYVRKQILALITIKYKWQTTINSTNFLVGRLQSGLKEDIDSTKWLFQLDINKIICLELLYCMVELFKIAT